MWSFRPRTVRDDAREAVACAALFAAIAPDARPYRPGIEFWSDGAAKARWVFLPPGEKIDVTMPPIVSRAVDVEGHRLLEEWIASLPACPRSRSRVSRATADAQHRK